MARRKILILEDEEDLRLVYKEALEGEGFLVLAASCAQDALETALACAPDLILADVALPGEDGIAFCRRLRSDGRTARIPLLLMSAVRRGEAAQAEGIDLGADDYLVKPFSHGLLTAKIRALLRRSSPDGGFEEALSLKGLRLDWGARKARLRGRDLPLTRKEFDILGAFLRKPGRVLSAAYLLETVWGYDPAQYNDSHTVEVHVSSLRKKLGRAWGKRIVSVPRLGYRLDP